MAASVLCNTVCVDPEDLPVGEIDNLVKQYNLTLKSITDHHAPLKTKVLRARPSAPWYSAEFFFLTRRLAACTQAVNILRSSNCIAICAKCSAFEVVRNSIE